jgi:hypothetical protein
MTMSMDALHLTLIPTVNVGMLIRRPPEEVFQAFVDPAISTKFWFTKSSGTTRPGAVLQWDWEMFDHRRRPIDCSDAPAVQFLADQRHRDAVSTAKLQESISGLDGERLNRPHQPLCCLRMRHCGPS